MIARLIRLSIANRPLVIILATLLYKQFAYHLAERTNILPQRFVFFRKTNIFAFNGC